MFLIALCDNPNFLRTLLFVKTIIQIISVVVPILLIVFLMVDLFKNVINKELDNKSNKKIIKNRIIAAIVIFFVPTVINLVGVITNSVTEDDICFDKATSENIAYMQSIIDAREEANRKSIAMQREEAQKEENKEEIEVEEIVKESISPEGSAVNVGTTNYYNQQSPEKGAFGSFSYNDEPEGRDITMNPAWKKANLITYSISCGGWNYKKTIHKVAKPYFDKAFKNICTLLTTGINGYKLKPSDLKNGGVFNERKTSRGGYSNHAWGMAVDFNYSVTYKIGNGSFVPYKSSGTKTFKEYCRFVKALGGNEKDNRNINYVLWKYAFEPAGFCWGGNWSESYFDPMHYEVNWDNRKCPTKNNVCD